jgi:hypothetical protein
MINMVKIVEDRHPKPDAKNASPCVSGALRGLPPCHVATSLVQTVLVRFRGLFGLQTSP